MTTLNEATEAIYDRFLTNFTGLSTDRINLDNEDFREPSSGAWVRLTVRGGPRTQETLGRKTNRRFRTAATVAVQVYVEADTGVKLSQDLAKEAADIFEGESFSGLDFFTVDTRRTGPTGRWYQTLVEAEFDFDEIK